MLAPALHVGACVVLESTTHPGTTEELVRPILERGSGLIAGVDFHLGYSPERIDPGSTVWRFENTPKIVSGIDDASLKVVSSFYDTLVDRTIPVSSPRVAELVKLLENTFRHINVALVNEVAMFAHDLDIDIWRRSTRPRRNRSATCVSHPGPESAAIVFPSTRRTCRGTSGVVSVSRFGSSSSPTTSTATCRTTSYDDWSRR